MRSLIPFLLGLLVLAAILRVDFLFTVLYFLLAVFILTRLWRGRTLTSVQVQRRFVGRAFHGDKVTVELTVRNNGWLPIPWLELHEALPAQLATPPFHRQVISLGSRERRCLRYELHSRRRGYYSIGPLKLASGCLLGIHPAVSSEVNPEYLVVYPRVLPLARLGLPTRSPLVALPARSPLFEDPSNVTGVRDYQRGDSPRRIHWTASASTGRLVVKQYRPSIARETVICLDMDRDGYQGDYRYTAPELAVVVAASIANHVAVREGLPLGLTTEGMDPVIGGTTRFFLPPRRGRGQLMGVLEVLARVDAASVTPLPTWLRREGAHLTWGSTLVVITGQETETLYDSLIHLRRSGFPVILILIQPGARTNAFQQRAGVIRVPVFRVWRELELRGGFGDGL